MFIKSMTSEYWFQNKKYIAVGDLVDSEICKVISDEYYQKSENGEGTLDEQCPKSSAWYGQPKLEWLMVDTLPKVEKITGLKLHPTYSYIRVYRPGEVLEYHQDRGSCEISVTLNLGQSSEYDWPIWAADPKDITNRTSISCPPGHAMIYRGCEVPHWREEFTPPNKDDWQCQVFLHYVDKFGPHADRKYDGRQRLFTEEVKI